MEKGKEGHTVIPITTVISDKIRTGQITVTGAAPVAIAQREARNNLRIRNNSGVDVYIGTQNVSAKSGFLIKASDTTPLELRKSFSEVYGIVSLASTSAIVSWLEE